MVCSFCRGTGQGTGLGVHQSKSHCKEFKDKTDEIFRELQEELYPPASTTDVLPTRKKAKELATIRKKQEWKEHDQELRRRQREAEAEFQEGLSRQADAVRRAEFREELRMREELCRRAEREAMAEARRKKEVDRQRRIQVAHTSRLMDVMNGEIRNIPGHLVRESVQYFGAPHRRDQEQSISILQRLTNYLQNLQPVASVNNIRRSLHFGVSNPTTTTTTTTTDIKIKTVKEPFESSECPVCMEEFGKTDIMVTACGHKFHTTCMFTHLRKANNCPCCRGVLF
jgi:hypothetical protein